MTRNGSDTDIVSAPIPPFALSIPEAARLCRIGRSTLYRELESGRLQSIHVGRRRLITTTAIQEWLSELGTASNQTH